MRKRGELPVPNLRHSSTRPTHGPVLSGAFRSSHAGPVRSGSGVGVGVEVGGRIRACIGAVGAVGRLGSGLMAPGVRSRRWGGGRDVLLDVPAPMQEGSDGQRRGGSARGRGHRTAVEPPPPLDLRGVVGDATDAENVDGVAVVRGMRGTGRRPSRLCAEGSCGRGRARRRTASSSSLPAPGPSLTGIRRPPLPSPGADRRSRARSSSLSLIHI